MQILGFSCANFLKLRVYVYQAEVGAKRKRDQRTNDKHRRKFSLSPGMNEPFRTNTGSTVIANVDLITWIVTKVYKGLTICDKTFLDTVPAHCTSCQKKKKLLNYSVFPKMLR